MSSSSKRNMFAFFTTFLPPKRDKESRTQPSAGDVVPFYKVSPTKQFGVTLEHIWTNNEREIIPRVVTNCTQYLDTHKGTPQLFHVSISQKRLKDIKDLANKGEDVRFESAHEAAITLTTFFRELKEPLIPCALYRYVVDFGMYSEAQRLRQMSVIVRELMPYKNYLVLKFLAAFLGRVASRGQSVNNNIGGGGATATTLAQVFGTYVVWPENRNLTTREVQTINSFVEFLLVHHRDIFKQ